MIARIGASVDAELDATLWRLVGGEISLSDVTGALQDWWTVAAEFGRQTANSHRIERLEWLASYWAWRAMNPGKDYYRAMTDQLWVEAAVA